MTDIIQDLKDQVMGYYDNLIIVVPKLIVAALILFVIWVVAKGVRNRLVGYLSKKSSDPLLSKFIGRIFNIIMMTIGLIIFLKIVGMGAVATGLMGTAGVGAFVIGFAFKDIGEHFLAGFILAFNRPFNVGDLVELDGQKGKVVSLNIRDTQLKTFDGRDLFIPNGNIIKNTLVNYTIDGYMRNHFTIGLDYGADLNKAIKIILETIVTVPGLLLEDKKPSVGVENLGASALNLNVYYWLDTFDTTVNGSDVKIEAINKVLKELDAAGIYLPGDIIELKNYDDSKLKLSESNNS